MVPWFAALARPPQRSLRGGPQQRLGLAHPLPSRLRSELPAVDRGALLKRPVLMTLMGRRDRPPGPSYDHVEMNRHCRTVRRLSQVTAPESCACGQVRPPSTQRLDPAHFQVPQGEHMAEDWDAFLESGRTTTHCGSFAETGGWIIGWLSARNALPEDSAAIQLTREHGWTALAVDALIVDQAHWRNGLRHGIAQGGRGHDPGRPDCPPGHLAHSPVSVFFMKIAWVTSGERSHSRNGKPDGAYGRSVPQGRTCTCRLLRE